jgi:predicted methyltransferase
MKPWIISTALLAAGLISAPAAAHDHDALAKAIAGEHRTAENSARDAARNPQQTLEFFGFDQGLTIVEVFPGGGWYTEILAPAVRGHGKLVAASFPEGSTSEYMQRVRGEFLAKLAAEPAVYDQVEVIGYTPGANAALGAPGSADLVVSFRNLHSFYRNDTLAKFFADAFAVLKSGGTLGIVQHRAPAGADPEAGKQAAYLPQAVGGRAGRGGRLQAGGEQRDQRQPAGYGGPPGRRLGAAPSLRHGDTDREKYLAIGESDRMTLRFTKP